MLRFIQTKKPLDTLCTQIKMSKRSSILQSSTTLWQGRHSVFLITIVVLVVGSEGFHGGFGNVGLTVSLGILVFLSLPVIFVNGGLDLGEPLAVFEPHAVPDLVSHSEVALVRLLEDILSLVVKRRPHFAYPVEITSLEKRDPSMD